MWVRRKRQSRWPLPLFGLLLAYLASPYYRLYAFSLALESGEREALENSVDFPSLRDSLKQEATSAIASASSEKAPSNPLAAGLVALFAPKLVDAFVESYVTPAGISELLREGRPNLSASDPAKRPPAPSDGLRLEKLRYAFFSSPTTFRVETSDALVLYFQISDWRWKLSRIALPPFQSDSTTEPAA